MTDYITQSLIEIGKYKPKGHFDRLKNFAYPTISLFLEPSTATNTSSGVSPLFTFKENDHLYTGLRWPNKTYISLRKLYLEIADPTEYLFAKQVFGNYDHWKCFFRGETVDDVGRLVVPYGWFEAVLGWRVELELALRAKGLKEIIERSGNSANAKWLVDRGWTTEGSLMGSSRNKRGRPSVAEVSQRADIISRVSADRNKVIELRGHPRKGGERTK